MVEILLLIAVLAAGASALFVAASFNARVKRSVDPIERNAGAISRQVGETNKNLQQLKDIANKLNEDRQSELDVIRHQIEQVGAGMRQDKLRGDLEKLDRQVGRLGESFARQRALMARIENYIKGREIQEGSSAKMNSLVSAMLDAEAFVARGGWRQPPQLFSLAKKSSLAAADQKLSDELQDAEPDALIPVAQDPLEEGQPFDVLASIRWPDEVVGCVLVTEIVTLPSEVEKDAPDDPVVAEQWASAHPASREARLSVCVSRDGAYICGLRIKGEDDIQVEADLADDIVAALLATF
jgi:hypothetical protein